MFGRRGSGPVICCFQAIENEERAPLQSTPRERLLHYAQWLQGTLFGIVEAETGPLSGSARLLIAVLEMIPLSRQLPCARGWLGRPAKDRQALASAFIAKAVYRLESTRQLRQRLHTDRQLRCLCGWTSARQIPHESTFSRAFQEFAETELPQRLHEALILYTQQGRLIGHIARDSSAIAARERRHVSPPPSPQAKRPRGCTRPGEPTRSQTRLPRQRRQSLQQMLKELPRHCSLGVKKGSSEHQQCWVGYKLHLDVADGQIPIACLLTAASLHDSQVAIPLATITAQRVTSLYDLMDGAYDASLIRAHSQSLGHVPLIAVRGCEPPIPKRVQASLRRYHKRKKVPTRYPRQQPPFTPAQQQRFQERTMVERVYSRLKDEFGARFVRVRGARKVMAHLMFGVLALTVDQLLKLTG
jgi:transposase